MFLLWIKIRTYLLNLLQSFFWTASLNWYLLECCIVSSCYLTPLFETRWMTETFNFLCIDFSFNTPTHQMGALRKFFRKSMNVWDNCNAYRRDTYFGPFDEAITLFPHCGVPLDLCYSPTIKASLSKDWEDDWQDSVSDYSGRLTIGFILSLNLRFWGLARPVI